MLSETQIVKYIIRIIHAAGMMLFIWLEFYAVLNNISPVRQQGVLAWWEHSPVADKDKSGLT